MTTTPFDPVAFGRSSADEAIDQASTYGGVQQAIDAYFDNVMDTCREHDVDQRDGIEAFERRLRELRAD